MSWTLVDVCADKSLAGSGIVASGSGYTEKGNQEVQLISVKKVATCFQS